MSFTTTLASNAVYRICNVLVIFLITALLSRLMGVSGYGLLSLLIVNGTLFNLITSFGIDSGITYHVASKPASMNRIVTVILLILFLQIILFGIIETGSFVLHGHLWLLKTKEQKFWWMGLSFLVSISLQEKYTAILNGTHLYTLCNKTILLCNALSLFVFAVFFFIIKPQSFNLYLLLFVLLSLFQALALVLVSHTYARISFRFLLLKKEEFSIFFSYSLLVFVTNCIQFLAYRVDYWLLDFYRNEKELGLYSLAVRLVQFYWILPLLFASIIFPGIVASKTDYKKKNMLALLRIMNTINFVSAIVLLFIIKPLIIAIFGKEYEASAFAFQILLPGLLLFCNTIILASFFAGRNKLKVNFWGSVFCFISIFLLDVFLIPENGVVGAALASSIGYSLTTVYFIMAYCRENNNSFLLLFAPKESDWKHLRVVTKNFFIKSR